MNRWIEMNEMWNRMSDGQVGDKICKMIDFNGLNRLWTIIYVENVSLK